ncbi:C45 family peptidase [bacterium]|nr:C45 family peptidase [bacterium]
MVTQPFALRTLHLSGSDREIGRQHGEALGECVGQGMIAFYRGVVGRLLSRSQPVLRPALNSLFVNPWLRRMPSESATQRIQGLAEVSGIPEGDLRLALVLPDVGPLLQGALGKWFPSLYADLSQIRLGCSSFMASGERFLVGRNLDFPGVGYWDRFPVIQCVTPKQGLRAIHFTTAGVPIGGITGINEAQIFVAIHQHYCRTYSLSGTLPFLIGERILNEARSLKDAQEILQSARLSNGWAFILADGKTRESLVWEASPNTHAVLQPQGGVLAHANAFQSTACRGEEYATTAQMAWDNQARRQRLEALVRKAGPGLTPAQACAAISDHWDGFWEEEKVVNRTVSMGLNVQSVVVDPERMEAWVATGETPVHLREYQKVDLAALFAGQSGLAEERLPGFRFSDPRQAAAKEAYVGGFGAWLDGDREKARLCAEASLQSWMTPEIALTAAICRLQMGEFSQAADVLEAAAGWMESRLEDRSERPPEYFENRLYRGRVCDLLGKREEAKAHYAAVASAPGLQDAHVRRIAQRARRFSARQLRFAMPFSSYAPFF